MTYFLSRTALAAVLLMCITTNPAAARSQPASLTLDGLRDDSYELLAQDLAGDLASDFSTDPAATWADLTSLSVATDTTHLWVYVDLPNYSGLSQGEFGLAVDTNGLASSGSAQDPWGAGITFAYTSTYNNVDTTPVLTTHVLLPDVVIRGHLFSIASAQDNGWVELRAWTGSAWDGAAVNWGGISGDRIGDHIAFDYGHGLEFSLPFSDLGVPPTTTLHLEFYATGPNGIATDLSGAWDTVPSDAQSSLRFRSHHATAPCNLQSYGRYSPGIVQFCQLYGRGS